MNCIGCNSITQLLSTAVVVYRPKVVIEKATTDPFELIGINSDQYYAERTNLVVKVKYPTFPFGHPQADQVIADYQEQQK